MARKSRHPAPTDEPPAKSKGVQQRYFSINQLATHLGISRRSVYALIEAGAISPPRRIGSSLQRFDMQIVQPQLDAMFAGATPIDDHKPTAAMPDAAAGIGHNGGPPLDIASAKPRRRAKTKPKAKSAKKRSAGRQAAAAATD